MFFLSRERERYIKNETGLGERRIGRETWWKREGEREPQRRRRRDRGETKIERET